MSAAEAQQKHSRSTAEQQSISSDASAAQTTGAPLRDHLLLDRRSKEVTCTVKVIETPAETVTETHNTRIKLYLMSLQATQVASCGYLQLLLLLLCLLLLHLLLLLFLLLVLLLHLHRYSQRAHSYLCQRFPSY